MRFFQHSSDEVSEVILKGLPEELSQLLLPHAQGFITKGSFGWVLSQCISEHHVEIWQHHFSIDHPCKLIAVNDEPALIINYMIKGSPYFKIAGLREPPAEEGTYRMYFVPQIEHTVSFSPGKFHCVHINYSPGILRKAAMKHEKLGQLVEFAIGDGTTINPYQSGNLTEQVLFDIIDLLWYPDIKGDRTAFVLSLTWKILRSYILRHHAMREDLLSLQQYILTNLKHPIRSKQLEMHCAMSRSKLYRLFKLHFNKSPAEYIQYLRVEEAKKFLLNTEMNITQIAEEVGFVSISSFNRTFRKYTKYAPSQYRQAFR